MTALGEALGPLYRAYLRRLGEMAGRIGEDTALREPLLRDDAQRLVRNEEGFTTRFDLADARTGETFEVHGAHPDEPASREVAVGGLPFLLEPGNWEELTIRCVLAEAAAADAAPSLMELLRSWAVVAAHGGFTPSVPVSPGWSGRLHSAGVRTDGAEVVASLDLGTCPPSALDGLAEALAAFGRERAPIARVVIGGTARKDS